MRFNPSIPLPWVDATKHGTMLVKPASLVVIDPLISQKILLETLEGQEKLGEAVVICVGPFQDVWQQTAKTVLTKYDVRDINSDGWLVCTPKSGNRVQAIQITAQLYYEQGDCWTSSNMHDWNDAGEEVFHVVTQWGTKRGDDTVQYGGIDDWVLRSFYDPTDIWIVKSNIFKNTYKVIE